jgi:hypothetical protein
MHKFAQQLLQQQSQTCWSTYIHNCTHMIIQLLPNIPCKLPLRALAVCHRQVVSRIPLPLKSHQEGMPKTREVRATRETHKQTEGVIIHE